MPGRARSASEPTARSLAGTAMTSRFVANTTGCRRAALRRERVGELRVRRGVDVGLDALADLRRELVGAGEREAHRGAVEARGCSA